MDELLVVPTVAEGAWHFEERACLDTAYLLETIAHAQSWGYLVVRGERPRIGCVAFVFPLQQLSMEGMDHTDSNSPKGRQLTCGIVARCLHNFRNFNFMQCLCEMVVKCYQTPIIFIHIHQKCNGGSESKSGGPWRSVLDRYSS